MDLSTELEHAIDEMESRYVLCTVQEKIAEILVDTTNPLPLPPFHAGQRFNTYPQRVECLCKRYPLGATSHSIEQPVMTAPGFKGEQAAPSSYQEPLHSPTVLKSNHLDNLEVFHSKGQARKCENQQDEHRPYIKKPLNAFMLFRKEHISNVLAEQEISNCAAANIVLGQRWKGLSKEEQVKYYQEAEKEQLLHAHRYPDWSCKDNYGIKKKKRKALTRPEVTASTPKEVVHENKKLCSIPAQIAVMKPSTSHGVMEAPHTQTAVTESSTSMVIRVHHTQREETESSSSCTVTVELPHVETAVTVICHLPQVYEADPKNSTEETALG